jgi:hypothetical protein
MNLYDFIILDNQKTKHQAPSTKHHDFLFNESLKNDVSLQITGNRVNL